MAANSKTFTQPDPEATDGNRRRRGNTHANTSTRRESHGPSRLARRFAGARSKSTSTELVPYNPSQRASVAPRSLRAQVTRLLQSATLSMHRINNRPPKVKTAKVVVVVPAHNEEESIARTIKALLGQSRQPDRIVVVADNCSDRTVAISRSFGRRVTVIETVGNRP